MGTLESTTFREFRQTQGLVPQVDFGSPPDLEKPTDLLTRGHTVADGRTAEKVQTPLPARVRSLPRVMAGEAA